MHFSRAVIAPDILRASTTMRATDDQPEPSPGTAGRHPPDTSEPALKQRSSCCIYAHVYRIGQEKNQTKKLINTLTILSH